MAKEKFLIAAVQLPDDCFGRFSETANRAAIDKGETDAGNPYSWIEASFEIVLVRHREATHICSFTPSARQEWMQNYFVGIPNEAWEYDADPNGLEYESGGETSSYGKYRDEYDSRFICESFTIDTVKDLGLRAPGPNAKEETRNHYLDSLWAEAIEQAQEFRAVGACDGAPILDAFTFRQWECEREIERRERAARLSKFMESQA